MTQKDEGQQAYEALLESETTDVPSSGIPPNKLEVSRRRKSTKAEIVLESEESADEPNVEVAEPTISEGEIAKPRRLNSKTTGV
jgi:hypothetical protein